MRLVAAARDWVCPIGAIAGRELASYVATPVAAVFLVVFLLLQAELTFGPGDWFGRDQADLAPFFGFLPWVLLLLVPALTMRLWAEERRLGTIELLLTLPIGIAQAVLGKYLAAWVFCALAVLLTFPFVITVNWLGHPDNGVIAAGYLGSVLLAGAFAAVGSAASAATRSQVVAFAAALTLGLVFVAAAHPLVTEALAARWPALAAFGRRISIAERFQDFSRGVIALRDLLYFASFIGFWLATTVAVLSTRASA